MGNLSHIIARVKSYEPLWDGWICTGELLGSGRMSCVLALSRGEERSVVKVICVENDPEEYQMVKNEIDTMLSFHGDNLVECLHSREKPVLNRHGDCTGYDILIHMHEYLPLSQYLKEEDYDPVELCRQLVLDIGMALGSLHAKGILHRDIKPENIFLDTSTDKTHYRLGDFGVSKKLEGLSGLTATGTPDFMAPESLWYYEYSYCSDIYSLGMTLYYILNDLHFPQFSDGQSQQDLWENNSRRLSGEKMSLPKFGDSELQSVVLKCCEAEPKKRYQDVSEMLNELLGQHFVPFGMKRKDERSELKKMEIKRKRFHRVLIISVATVTIVAITAISVLILKLIQKPSVDLNHETTNTTSLIEATVDPKLSQYTSDFIDIKVDEFHQKAAAMRQNQNYSTLYNEDIINSATDVHLLEDNSLYIKKHEDEDSWRYYTHFTEYFFNSDGALFYICQIKTDETNQLYIYNDDIICMTTKGDPNKYYYGDPEITEEMKAMVTQAYELYNQYPYDE